MNRTLVSLMIIAMMISLENGMASTFIPVVVQTRHAIKNAQGHGKPKTTLKSSLTVIPYNTDDTLVVDDDQTLGRNRKRLAVVNEQEEELSDYVKIRLMLARMKAMRAYSMANCANNLG
jgi:hypothetical protein